MDALAAGHDAGVQMIDTSVVRGTSTEPNIADNNQQEMGRSGGGLTSKIHAVVDTNADRGYDADWIRSLPASKGRG